MEKILGIVIILNENEKQNLEKTYQSINIGQQCKNILVASSSKVKGDCEEFCRKNKIEMYTFKNIKDLIMYSTEKMNCKYNIFLNAGDIVSNNIEQRLKKYLDKNSNENIVLGTVRSGNDAYILNRNLKKSSKISIVKEPNKIWINKDGLFIKSNFIRQIVEKLDEKSTWEEIIINLIALNGRYSYANNIRIKTLKQLEDGVNPKIEYYNINWYFSIFEIARKLLKNINIKYTQYAIMYIIKLRFNANVNMKNKHIITGELLKRFKEETKDILNLIEDDVIKNSLGNKNVNYFLLKMKYNEMEKLPHYTEFYQNLCTEYRNDYIFEAENIKIKILLMDYDDGNLKITANYSFPFDENKLKICAIYNNNKYYAKRNFLYSDYKIFGETIYSNYTFDVNIPLQQLESKAYIEFYLEGNKTRIKLDLNFARPLSRLYVDEYSYWNVGRYTLNYRNSSILILKRTALRTLKRELKYLKYLLNSRDEQIKKCASLRIKYFLTKPFFRKKIWLFEDKIYKAGDNGEYLYNYAIKKKDKIKKYYILSKDSIDSKRFEKQGKKYVDYGTTLHKLLLLNSDIVFETHNNLTVHHSFDEKIEKYFRGLFNSKNVCIQHGLTVQYIPHLTNRINDNLKAFFLASPIEYKNMLDREYDYTEHKNILKITGSPRYDGLKNNDKKQILITPSWRNYLATPISNIDETRAYNKEFINSDYFRIYNNLINNTKLIEKAKKNGYKIIYLLHPCTSPQIDDFDKNDYVDLIAATDDLNYEKILTESSLMITDYSGVQFDFAYMYKPIIYFHPKELPPSYEEGEYKYETMALGEIVNNSEQLVDLICEYMDNECKIKNEYKNRIDKFFKYHDYNNCERVYNEIIKEFYNN